MAVIEVSAKREDITRFLRKGPVPEDEKDRVIAALRRKLKKVEKRNGIDALTGVGSLWALKEAMQVEGAKLTRRIGSISMVFVDGDDFGLINKTKGDAAGDEALICMANALVKSARISDKVFRKGGDEFVVILYDGKKGVEEYIRRVNEALLGTQISASAGGATLNPNCLIDYHKIKTTMQDLMNAANANMLAIKRQKKMAEAAK